MTADLTPSSPSIWRRIWLFWLRFEPMRHEWWETFTFRIAISYVAWDTLAGPSRFHSQPFPHGLAAWGFDFSWAGSDALMQWLVPLIGVCLVLYMVIPVGQALAGKAGRSCGIPWLNWLQVAVLLPPLYASFAHGTLGNSQDSIGHTTHIVTLALLAQWLALAWAAIRGDRSRLPRGFDGQQLAADWTRQIIAATYVTSGITKLWVSHGHWLSETPYFALQIVKSTGQGYYEFLTPPGNASWMAQILVDHPLLAELFIGIGLPLELGFFLSLYNRRSALFFGVVVIAFHSCVTEIMHLGFVYHKILLLALFVNPLWWIVAAFRRMFFAPLSTPQSENASQSSLDAPV